MTKNDNKNQYAGLYVPSVFNAKERLEQEGFKQRYIEAQSDKYNYFLHLIHFLRVINPKYNQHDFIKINRTLLEDTVGDRYVRDIFKLIIGKWKLVECDGQYCKGKSLGYRFTVEFTNTFDKVILTDIVNERFESKLQNFRLQEIRKMDEPTHYIAFHLTNVGINLNGVKTFIETNYPIALDNQSENYVETHLKVNSYLTSVEMFSRGRAINDGNYHTSREKKGNRCYHNLVFIKREFRYFLYLKDNPNAKIISLDVANSQPFALCKLIIDRYCMKDLPDDVQRYFIQCQGKLYDDLKELWGLIDRDAAKDAFFKKVLFCKREHLNNTYCRIFADNYPNVFQVIYDYKKKDNSMLALELQKIESSAIIDGVVNKIIRKYKHTKWFSTIHDSILCTEDMVNEVRELMIECYSAVVGLTPKIKAPEWINKGCLELTPEQISNQTGESSSLNLEQLNSKLQDLEVDRIECEPSQNDDFELYFNEDDMPCYKPKRNLSRGWNEIYINLRPDEKYHDYMARF